MPENEFPKLRNGLEAFPIEHSGKTMILLRDRIGYSSEHLVFSPPAVSVLSKMNGGNSMRDLQTAFMKETGQLIYIEDLQNLVQALDDHLFLDNEKFRDFAAKEIAAFLRSPVRKTFHAGRSYPADPEELRALLDSFFRVQNGGPGLPGRSGKERIVGMVAPHIDLNAGGPCFAHAYKASAEAQCPDTWIVLGTGHDLVENGFALTARDFETPLGIVRHDNEICRELLRSVQFDVRASEYNHRIEHTIEFQAVFLAHMQPGARIVPILCSFGHDDWNSLRDSVDSFAALLADLVFGGKFSVGVLASVDLAHVGPRYGDQFKPHQGTIQAHMASDEILLKMLQDCRASDFIERINRDGNSRKVCGVAPLYTLAKVLQGRAEGVTLAHTHAGVDEQNSFVTFASMAFYEKNPGEAPRSNG